MARISTILALLALAALYGAAQAASTKPNIGACVAAAETMDAMRKCKRIVFEPCIKEPDHMQSTHGLVMCNSREADEWQALLKARTADLKKRDTYRANALTAAEKAWRTWVDAECFWHREEAMGGSAEGPITTECISDLTAERVILLTWQMRGNVIY